MQDFLHDSISMNARKEERGMKQKYSKVLALVLALVVSVSSTATAYAEGTSQALTQSESNAAIIKNDIESGSTAPESNLTQPAIDAIPLAAAEGDGYTWDETSKTLTITASTGDYAIGKYGPWHKYSGAAKK